MALKFVALILLAHQWGGYGAKLPIYIASAPPMIEPTQLDHAKTNITLMYLFSFTGLLPMGNLCLEEIKFALDRVTSTPNMLDGYNLKLEILDDACSWAVGVNKAIRLLIGSEEDPSRIPFALGGLCPSHLHNGAVYPHYNYTGFTHASVFTQSVNRANTTYRNFYIFWAKLQNTFEGLFTFIEHMGWRKVAYIGENSEFYNQVEQFLDERFSKQKGPIVTKMIGTFKFPYISGAYAESDELEASVKELAAVKPRIIVVATSTVARLACWLHRYKLYGPNYVYFMLLAFELLPFDPSRFRPWCTEQMLLDVSQSVIYFGYTSSMNLFGNDAMRDTTGLSGGELESHLRQVLENPESSPSWFPTRCVCYDVTMMGAHILDDVDKLLKAERNESLRDWRTHTALFKQKGQIIVDYFRKALLRSRYRSFWGELNFDPVTKINEGHVNIGILQAQKQADGTMKKVPVASFEKVSGRGLIMGPGKAVWLTPDGNPPFDSVQTLLIFEPQLSIGAYSAITALSILILLLAVIFMVLLCVRRSTENVATTLPELNAFILAGDALLQGYILAQERHVENAITLARECMIGYAFLFAGFLMTIYGMASKFAIVYQQMSIEAFRSAEQSKKKKKKAGLSVKASISKNISRPSALPSAVGSKKPTEIAIEFENTKMWVFLGFGVLAFCILISVVWFLVAPITAIKELGQLDEFPNNDYSLALQYYSIYCKIVGVEALGFISAYIVLAVIILFRTGFLAYTLRGKRFANVRDLPMLANCLYGTTVMMICGAIIAGAVFNNDAQKMKLAISGLIFGISSLNLSMIFIVNFVKK